LSAPYATTAENWAAKLKKQSLVTRVCWVDTRPLMAARTLWFLSSIIPSNGLFRMELVHIDKNVSYEGRLQQFSEIYETTRIFVELIGIYLIFWKYSWWTVGVKGVFFFVNAKKYWLYFSPLIHYLGSFNIISSFNGSAYWFGLMSHSRGRINWTLSMRCYYPWHAVSSFIIHKTIQQ